MKSLLDDNKSKLVFIIVASFTYALSIIVTKIGLNVGLEVSSYTFLTMLFAAVFLLPYYFYQGKVKLQTKDYKDFLILGITSSGISHFLIFLGQSYTSAVNTGFLVKMATPFTAIFALLILKEKSKKTVWIAIFISLLGCFLLSSHNNLIFQIGDFFVIIAALFLGFSNAFAKNLMKKHSSGTLVFWRSLFGSIFLFFVSFVYAGNPFYSFSGYSLLNGMLIALTLLALYKSFDLIGPVQSSILFFMSSLFSAVFAVLLLSESIKLVQILGGALILIGAFLSLKK